MAEHPMILTRWQPYHTPQAIHQLIHDLSGHLEADNPQLWHALPFHYLQTLERQSYPSGVHFGLDNMLETNPDSFAAHIAAKMANEVKADFILLGGSDRRTIFQESNETIRNKVLAAVEKQVPVMLCISDPQQLSACLEGLSPQQTSQITLVFEGPWTGFYRDKGLIKELVNGREQLQNTLSQVVGDAASALPVLLALPSRLPEASQLVDKTLSLCNGYYLPKAALNPVAMTQLLYAMTTYQRKLAAAAEDVAKE